jgi:hypothetical protein
MFLGPSEDEGPQQGARVEECQRDLGRTQDRTRRRRGDQDHQT